MNQIMVAKSKPNFAFFRFGAALMLFIFLGASDASAKKFKDYLEDAWDVVVDPIGLKSLGLPESTRNLKDAISDARHAIADLDRLEERTNDHVKRRLEQLASLVEQARGAANDVVVKTITEVRKLEKDIVADINDLIRNAECTAIRVSEDIWDRNLKNIRLLSKSEREVTLHFGTSPPPWYKFWAEPGPKSFTLDLIIYAEPSKAFEFVEEQMVANFDLAEDESTPRQIFQAYGALARLARNTQCHYLTQPDASFFARKAAYYGQLAEPWVEFARVVDN